MAGSCADAAVRLATSYWRTAQSLSAVLPRPVLRSAPLQNSALGSGVVSGPPEVARFQEFTWSANPALGGSIAGQAADRTTGARERRH